MPKMCRIGDPGSHGGVIITGSDKYYDNGVAVARVGDLYGCSIHGPNPLVEGSPDHAEQGKAVVRVGDHASCGAAMTGGSPTTWVNE